MHHELRTLAALCLASAVACQEHRPEVVGWPRPGYSPPTEAARFAPGDVASPGEEQGREGSAAPSPPSPWGAEVGSATPRLPATADAPPGDAPPGDAPPGDAPPADAPPADAPAGDAPEREAEAEVDRLARACTSLIDAACDRLGPHSEECAEARDSARAWARVGWPRRSLRACAELLERFDGGGRRPCREVARVVCAELGERTHGCVQARARAKAVRRPEVRRACEGDLLLRRADDALRGRLGASTIGR